VRIKQFEFLCKAHTPSLTGEGLTCQLLDGRRFLFS
jgi:hypothetical protein